MTSMLKIALGALAISVAPVALALQGNIAPTEPSAAPPITQSNLHGAERTALLKALAASLAETKTASGEFEQMSADYSVHTGTFALRRPGKMRFDYNEPTPVVIVSDGTTVALQDTELETTDRVPLSTTPLDILLDDRINFDEDTDVLDVIKSDGLIGVTVQDSSGEMDGVLTLIFNDSDNTLMGWRSVDGGGGVTSVQLNDVTYNERVNPRLFILSDIEDEDDD